MQYHYYLKTFVTKKIQNFNSLHKPDRFWGWLKKQGGWMEILPRFKIQYPMKNRDKYTPLCNHKIYPLSGIF